MCKGGKDGEDMCKGGKDGEDRGEGGKDGEDRGKGGKDGEDRGKDIIMCVYPNNHNTYFYSRYLCIYMIKGVRVQGFRLNIYICIF
jgi:hypothetical protein